MANNTCYMYMMLLYYTTTIKQNSKIHLVYYSVLCLRCIRMIL